MSDFFEAVDTNWSIMNQRMFETEHYKLFLIFSRAHWKIEISRYERQHLSRIFESFCEIITDCSDSDSHAFEANTSPVCLCSFGFVEFLNKIISRLIPLFRVSNEKNVKKSSLTPFICRRFMTDKLVLLIQKIK